MLISSGENFEELGNPSYEAKAGKDAGERLFELDRLAVSFDEGTGTLWSFMAPIGRPSYSPALLDDFHAWQRGIAALGRHRAGRLRHVVLGSRWPGVFNLGGDLALFEEIIRRRDKPALVAYGRSCVRILHRNLNGLGLPIVTVALAEGDALGGGFESLLSFNVVVAERGARFGFPERLFGLFPGMGACSLLWRRLGERQAEEMILGGRIYSAEELHALGIVQVLAEPGEGQAATRDLIARHNRSFNAVSAVYRARREVGQLPLSELERIVEIWAEASMQLEERDLRVMRRLVKAQDRLGADGEAPPGAGRAAVSGASSMAEDVFGRS